MPHAAPDWDALQGAISGDVILPGSPDYDSARKPAIARFHDVYPQAVVLCETPADVSETISFARRCGLQTAIRSGGHCFAGRSRLWVGTSSGAAARATERPTGAW